MKHSREIIGVALDETIDAKGTGHDEQGGNFPPVGIQLSMRFSQSQVICRHLHPGLENVIGDRLEGEANELLFRREKGWEI